MGLTAVNDHLKLLFKCRRSLAVLFSALVCLGGALSGQNITLAENLVITDIRLSLSDEVRIEFSETGEGYAEYIVESIVDLGGVVSTWDEVEDANFEALGNASYSAVFPYSDTGHEFYRSVGIGTAGDADGDGLNTAEENLLGTNVNDPDSDGDGYSDGLEADLGTDPLDEDDTPPFDSQPRVQFAQVDSVVN